MTALGVIVGTVSVGVGSGAPVELATFDLPIVAHLSRDGGGVITLGATIGPESLGSAIAGALREVADRFDPGVHDLTPVDALPPA